MSRFDDVALGRGVQIPLDCQRSTGTDPGYRTRLRRNWTGAKPTGLPMFLGGTGPVGTGTGGVFTCVFRFFPSGTGGHLLVPLLF
jgi:hypothetical protein